MATKVTTKTTFEALRTIEPIYTGGEIVSNKLGNLIASCVDEEDVLVFDLSTAKPLARIEGDGEAITSLCLSPSTSHLVACSRSLSMRIFALTQDQGNVSAKLLRTIKPHTTPVIASSIDKTGSLLATGGADGIVKVWDIQGGYCSHTFHGHGGVVTALTFFEADSGGVATSKENPRKRKIQRDNEPDIGQNGASQTILLASGGEDGKIKIWNLTSRKNVANLDSHTSVVRALQYSAEQKLLLSAGRDRTIVLWDVKSWGPQKIIPTREELEAAGFSDGGKFCYGGGESGKLRIWTTGTGKEVLKEQETDVDSDTIVAILSIPAEDCLLVVHGNQVMELRSTRPMKQSTISEGANGLPLVRRISGNHDEIIDIACVGLERNLLALGDNTESVKIVSIGLNDNEQLGPSFGSNVAKLTGHKDVVICLDVDWSGHWLATGAKDNTARLWRLDPSSSSYDCFASFAGHTGSVGAVALPQAALSGGGTASDALKSAPPFLITGSEDKTVKKWDLTKLSLMKQGTLPHSVAKSVFTRVAHEKDINAIATSPVASLFASASQDRTIKIWSTEDGSVVGILRGHKRGVWSIQFSPANTPALNLSEGGTSGSRGLIVSGSGDNTVKVWSLSTYTCLLTFEGHQNSVLKVLWLPPNPSDEEQSERSKQQRTQPTIASASSDTLIKIWSPYASSDSDHLLTTLDNHEDRVWSLTTPLSAAPKSSKANKGAESSIALISGGADAKLTFWKDTSADTAEESSKAVNERIEQEQILQNHILARNYREVITLSLSLNHPGRLLKVFEEVVNLPEEEKEANSLMGVQAVDEVLGSLSQEEIFQLLGRVRDWNTNARTAMVAQKVLNCLFRKYPHSMWLDMARNRSILRQTRSQGGVRGSNGMKDLFRALEVYTDRHYKRMEELVDESYLIEYTLREMDEIGGSLDMIDGSGTNPDLDGDVIMV